MCEKDKGAKKRKLLKSIVYELMGNALELATAEKERCTWVASKHGGQLFGRRVAWTDGCDS